MFGWVARALWVSAALLVAFMVLWPKPGMMEASGQEASSPEDVSSEAGGLSCELLLTLSLDNVGSAPEDLTTRDAADLQSLAQVLYDGGEEFASLDSDGDTTACEEYTEEPLESQVAFSLSCEVFSTLPASAAGQSQEIQALAQGLYDEDPVLYAGFDEDSDGAACNEVERNPSASPVPARTDKDLLEAGGPASGALPLMPDGGCPEEFPLESEGACHALLR